MTDFVDRHELRLALEREEAIAKRLLGKSHEPLATAFFEIVYRTLNSMPFPTAEPRELPDAGDRLQLRITGLDNVVSVVSADLTWTRSVNPRVWKATVIKAGRVEPIVVLADEVEPS